MSHSSCERVCVHVCVTNVHSSALIKPSITTNKLLHPGKGVQMSQLITITTVHVYMFNTEQKVHIDEYSV